MLVSGEKKTLVHCWRECKLVPPLWRTVWRFLRKLKIRVAVWSSNPTPGHISGQNCISKRYMHPYVQSSTIHNGKTWKPPTDRQMLQKEVWLPWEKQCRETPKDGDTWEVSTIPSPGAHVSSVPHQRLDWGSLQDDPSSQLHATVQEIPNQDNPAKSHLIQTRRNKG